VMGPIMNHSGTPSDNLTGAGACGDGKDTPYQGRCGYGPRLPLLVLSPYAKVNYVDHTVTDQTSILRFIEDNWNLGRIGDHSMDEAAGLLLRMFSFEGKGQAKSLILDPATGLAISSEGLRPANFHENSMSEVGHASACQPAGRPGSFDSVSRRGMRDHLSYFTRQRSMPAETFGCMLTSTRNPVVVTGLNVTLLYLSFSTAYGPAASTGFHSSPSL
jgi:hypothetical protein